MSRTCLHENHRRLGATMVDFHGWEMPIRYTQIPEEHLRVRAASGLFDLCHMGRLEFSGPGAVDWVQSLVTSDVGGLDPGAARYGLVCNERGGILDDLIVYRLRDRLFMVVNASNREKVVAWFEAHRDGRDARLDDVSQSLAMLAIQGPASADVLTPLVESSATTLTELPYYHATEASVLGSPALVATTGYTGERGFEIFLDSEVAPALWDALLETGGDRAIPVGLGARDTLRVEAGMPLYGNELDEETNPYEARLAMAVRLEKGVDFVGREALAAVRARGPDRKLVGLKIESRRVAREGMAIRQDGRPVGRVTSGIPSPTLGFPVAMAYVESSVERPEGLTVDLRGSSIAVTPVPLPFFSNTRKPARRIL